MFSGSDLAQIEAQGISIDQIEQQLERFKNGFPSLPIRRAATIGDGLHRFDQSEVAELQKIFEENRVDLQLCKFVPASGAASRMFKSLLGFLNDYQAAEPDITSDKAIVTFFDSLHDFPFFDELNQLLSDQGGIDLLVEEGRYDRVVDGLLNGLNYSNLPKGLLTFHKYPDHSRTAVEEHLVEGAAYGRGKGDKVFLHFTVSPEHKDGFIGLLEQVLDRYQEEFKVAYQISFSEQKSSTDTIAVDLKNQPFRLDSQRLLFRPGGHGALLSNLNDLEADLVFIKNIDNVLVDKLKDDTITYKKLIAGLLIKTQRRVFDYHRRLELDNVNDSLVDEVLTFLQEELSIEIPDEIRARSAVEKQAFVLGKLNRPIRVCGIVENTGEPGGGPFWVENQDGTLSLQIGETAQIDMSNPEHKEIFLSSTHFSPTDLVCGLRNYKGEPFDLMEYIDLQTGFVAEKSQGGKDLKALELPGLWNGSMAEWNTIFVEVPLTTFTPVKTINDLLRSEHRA